MKPLILIVEDDPQIRRFLRATLGAEGYQFHEAVTAGDGIAQAEARRPDLILLDLGLPDRDGLEVFRRGARKMTRSRRWIWALTIMWPSHSRWVSFWRVFAPLCDAR
jgi:DNA-binding response OmpR family regulator